MGFEGYLPTSEKKELLETVKRGPEKLSVVIIIEGTYLPARSEEARRVSKGRKFGISALPGKFFSCNQVEFEGFQECLRQVPTTLALTK